MRIDYDRDVDAVTVTLSEAPSASTRQVNDLWLLDYGASGELVGMEFFAVSGGIRLSGAVFQGIDRKELARQLVEAGAPLVVIADWGELGSMAVSGATTRTRAQITTSSGFQSGP